ncbi:fimbria/pilus periplasmic chaperone [Serratia sp. JSRIV001]|uniref:fimbria/pilus periplasmic chaperone n=1 Tax=Serratia sp. JSRIV001 TaxID=2831893 RepID=UPI000742DCFF|nr:fimbria/pilus periplasmic chaperone [Serratia sp. JSRIV001]ALX95761.1 molecular chaperone [Serratia fonticola]UAN44187.1 fimbria/pilus periplasmic chaperone [Serratia sp. JSRIV001]
MKLNSRIAFILGVGCSLIASSSWAAIALDRTRVIVNETDKAVSLNISNQNKQLPYLAQSWIEDAQGNKITSPLVVLPPVQRVEAGEKSQIKVQVLPAANLLARDRETLYYFNLREIPPKSDKPNSLQIALQTRIKLFYRPAAIVPSRQDMDNPWQEKLTLTRQGDRYQVNNPTPYYVTLVDASKTKGATVSGFEPLMVAPLSSGELNISASALGDRPILTYVNDYGGRPALNFKCSGSTCQVEPDNSKK